MQREWMVTCGMSDVDRNGILPEEENSNVCNSD